MPSGVHNNHVKGANHHQWKGGRTLGSDGYYLIKDPTHSRSQKHGYVRECILIAEKALGKPLPVNAVVHHANGTRDSGPLVICQDEAYHKLLHRRTAAYMGCGHTDWMKCEFCQKWDDPKNMYVWKTRAYHRSCRNAKLTALRKFMEKRNGNQAHG